jgi:AcrR family transcriptional regulator
MSNVRSVAAGDDPASAGDIAPAAAGGEGRATALLSRKDSVRDAALTLFAERGFHATTMNDVAKFLQIRGPSLYNHIDSKQQLLAEIIIDFLRNGLAEQECRLAATKDPVRQLRDVIDVHVRIHTRYRREAFVGNREMRSLEEPNRSRVMDYRDQYSKNLIEVIERGVAAGKFAVEQPRLAGYAILEMGIGVATWFRADGPLSEDEVSRAYQEFGLRMVGAAS